MFDFGEICEIDAVRGYVKVLIHETGNVTEWIPFMRPFYAQSIPIELNEQVIVGETKSKRSFVFGSTPNNIDKPYTGASANKYGIKFTDGTLLEYDIDSHKLTASGPLLQVDITALSVTVLSPQISLEGIVTITGELVAAGGISMAAGAAMAITGGGSIVTDGDIKAGDISLKAHKHGGVQTGAGVTGNPIII
jgi:phage baseplate assembly protein V